MRHKSVENNWKQLGMFWQRGPLALLPDGICVVYPPFVYRLYTANDLTLQQDTHILLSGYTDDKCLAKTCPKTPTVVGPDGIIV